MARWFAGTMALMLGLLAQGATAAELRLLMVEQPGCIYCAKWDADNAAKYPLTAEGKAAPLMRMQLRDPAPDGVTLQRPAAFTPTFILLADGSETGRIEGYPSEDFFWPMLATLIDAASTHNIDAPTPAE